MAWAYAIQDKDPQMSGQLASFCKALKDEQLTSASILDFLGQEVVSQLKKALAGKTVMEPRDTNLLFSRLSGRRLPAEGIKKIVADWLGPGDENTIFSLEGGTHWAIQDSHPSPAWWPMLHPGIFSPGIPGSASYGLDKDILEKELEMAFPSSQLKQNLSHLKTDELIRFALGERFHFHAVFKAWQIACSRILSGEHWPRDISLQSGFMKADKAGYIEKSFSILSDISGLSGVSFPGQLCLRLSLEELIGHPYGTDELKELVFDVLQKWEKKCEEWAGTLPPVPVVPLEEKPVVIICDGVSADVWLKATEGNGLFYETGKFSLYRLIPRPVTIDAIAGLFGFSGDPLDEFHKHGVQYYSLKGNEEYSLPNQVVPLSDRTIVLRLSGMDQAGHEGRMSLKDMAAGFKALCDTQLYELYETCKKKKRKLIMTVDHGFTLGKSGLSHGQGGVFERVIPFAEWNVHP